MNSTRTCFPSVIGEDERTRMTGQSRLGTEEEWETCNFGPYRALAFRGENWEKRNVVRLDDIPRQKGHPYSRKMIWYDKQTLMPVYGMMYDRAGKPFKIINHILRWSEDTDNPLNLGSGLSGPGSWRTTRVGGATRAFTDVVRHARDRRRSPPGRDRSSSRPTRRSAWLSRRACRLPPAACGRRRLRGGRHRRSRWWSP